MVITTTAGGRGFLLLHTGLESAAEWIKTRAFDRFFRRTSEGSYFIPHVRDELAPSAEATYSRAQCAIYGQRPRIS